jgi:hypothetical protein
METSKTFENESGNILVRDARGKIGSCGVVEMLHLFSENKSGCVIAAWKVRKVDGENFPEMYVIHDRLTATEYTCDIMEALRYGQQLAEKAILN